MSCSGESSGLFSGRAGRWACALVLIGLAAAAAATGGCEAIGFLAYSYQENTPKTVEAEYDGLKGKSFAVVVLSDRGIDANYPGLIATVNAQINDRLYEQAAASAWKSSWIPSKDLLAYLYNHPRWVAAPRAELAKELGVDRLVVVEVQEFRVNDPGNQYLWDGRASGLVSVLEADAGNPDNYAFERPVDVKFPDQGGFGPHDMSADLVLATLRKRFVDRASWMFYTHEEKHTPDY